MSGEHSGNFPDLPPLEYFPPTPERELPTDLKDRAAWLEMEMAKVRREMVNLQVSAAATDRRRRDSVGTPSYPVDQEGAATPNYPVTPPKNPQTASTSYPHLPELLNLCMGMPQRKVPKFDGNPLNYWKFLRGFTSGVAQYVTDPANRLAFLIDACEGEAREAIDHCTILEPEQGYQEAWKILGRRFGNPSVIARQHIASITTGPAIKPNDASSLLKLADAMKACWLVLSQLNYSSELNTRTTIGAIINRLPSTIQSHWFDRASEILRKNREPNFVDLTDYIQDRADSLSVRESYLPSVSPPSASRSERPRSFVTTPSPRFSTLMTASVANKPSSGEHSTTVTRPCLYCGKIHYLDQCTQFVRLDADARAKFVHSAVLCELCLKPRHNAKQCRSRRCCGLNGCKGLHHPLLHPPTQPSAKSTRPTCQEECRSDLSVNCASGSCSRTTVALGVLPVTLRGPRGVCRVNALLDSGSDSTMLKEDVALNLGLSGLSTNISVATLNGQNEVSTTRVSFDIDTSPPAEMPQSVKAWTVRQLPSITRTLPTKEQWSKWDHLRGIPFENAGSQPISLLIGMDVPMAHWVLESRTGKPHEPYANRTPLGWVLFGPINNTNDRLARINQLSSHVEDNLDSKLEAMFDTEFRDPPSYKRSASQADEQALAVVESSLRLTDGRYEIALPWKAGCPSLPSNYLVARQRLNSLGKRLIKDRHLHDLYVTAVNEYLVKGYAEPVNHHPETERTGRIWYLPHHPVVHPHKPNKVRVVFDCACQVQGNSLNSQLLTGPDIVNSLLGVLLRFRQYRYVVTADIESMFHQVKVPESDRDVLRFLWWERGDVEQAPKTYRMTVHPFGATSSPFCASFALKHAIRSHASVSNHAELLAAERAFYVDDLLFSATSPERLAAFAFNLKVALAARGFRLTKWWTNEPVLLAKIPLEDRAQRNLDVDLQPPSWHRTLGVQWDMSTDEFLFQVDTQFETPTKRRMLSHIASLYDPMGFVCPALLPGRLLFQQLCRLQVKWDEELSVEIVQAWQKWRRSMVALTELRIPRCLSSRDVVPQSYELHCFSDASERAYGAVLYLRLRNEGHQQCYFVWGKSRVAPLKAVTIPRLELTAALLSARMATQAREELSLPIKSTTFWTDSMVVLQTLRNTTTRFQSFIANRKTAIHELTDVRQWKYVDGRNNPADIASRGVSPAELGRSSWIRGPTFLLDEESSWPTEPSLQAPLPSAMMKKTQNCTVAYAQSTISWLDKFNHYGSWTKLLRAITWLRRFCSLIGKESNSTTNPVRHLTRHEIMESSIYVSKLVQETAFPDELRILSKKPDGDKRTLVSSASPLRKLNPFYDRGVLRVGGRLRWAALPFETKHPIILPRRHFVTTLIIKHYHESYGHVGVGQVLAAVRNRYWVVQGQAAVRCVLSSCYHCRRWFSPPCYQMMAPLPTERTNCSRRPFAFTGVDYFGPLLVKRGRGTEKRYGCVFTCMTIRAVHIEVAHTLDTTSFLCAFSRFVARRGSPLKLYSDNGTNFRGAEADVKECLRKWDQDKLATKLLEHECDWVFSVPKASHRGGIWERLIRSIRRILRALLGDRLVDDETLQTTLTEIEKILNDRPLVKLTSDPNDYAALTPNHLLLLSANPAEASHRVDSRNLTKAWRHANHLADLFWNRWIKEYLPTLQTISKWLKQGRSLNEGDLVLLGDISTPRGQWEKGIVERAVHSTDGAVREAIVRTSRGTLRRDVRQLYLLEACGQDGVCFEERRDRVAGQSAGSIST